MVEARLEANSVSKVKKVARAVKEFAAVALLTASLMFNCATSKHSEMSSQEYTIENAQICKRRNCPDMLSASTFTKYQVFGGSELRVQVYPSKPPSYPVPGITTGYQGYIKGVGTTNENLAVAPLGLSLLFRNDLEVGISSLLGYMRSYKDNDRDEQFVRGYHAFVNFPLVKIGDVRVFLGTEVTGINDEKPFIPYAGISFAW